jgi:hypothetical protein
MDVLKKLAVRRLFVCSKLPAIGSIGKRKGCFVAVDKWYLVFHFAWSVGLL